MGFRDYLRSRSLEKRREPRIEFLGEQDGPPERDLKAALSRDLAEFPEISRAYLARVGYQPAGQPAVALCLVSSGAPEAALLVCIKTRFASMFNRDAALDILILPEEEESDVARVCAAFYAKVV